MTFDEIPENKTESYLCGLPLITRPLERCKGNITKATGVWECDTCGTSPRKTEAVALE